jgi:hypothetical protein
MPVSKVIELVQTSDGYHLPLLYINNNEFFSFQFAASQNIIDFYNLSDGYAINDGTIYSIDTSPQSMLDLYAGGHQSDVYVRGIEGDIYTYGSGSISLIEGTPQINVGDWSNNLISTTTLEFPVSGADNFKIPVGLNLILNSSEVPYYGDASMTEYRIVYDHTGFELFDNNPFNYSGVLINTGASDVDHGGLTISAHTSVAPDGSVLDLSNINYGSVFNIIGSDLSDVIYLTDTFDSSVEWTSGDDYIMGSKFGGIGDRFKGSNYKFEWGDPTDQVGVKGLTFEFNNGILTVQTDEGLTTAENISRVYGSRFDDVFIGDENYQNFRSEGGSNTYTGGVGEDSFRLRTRYDNGILRDVEARITDLEAVDKIGFAGYGFSDDLEVARQEFSIIQDVANNKTYISVDTTQVTKENAYTIDGIFYLDSYSMTEKYEDMISTNSNSLIIRMSDIDPASLATFTASIDKWQPGEQTSSTWLDGPSMKLHRKDIADNEAIDLTAKDGSPGHKHKPDMDKGNYELIVQHDQQTDGAIDIDDVMGVLSLSRGKSSPASKEHKLAADWNGDGIIDIDDVMGVLARSRGKSKEDEWRFHDKTTDTSLWDNATKTNKMDIVLENDDDIDLTAILRGDVNGSYNAGQHNRADPSPAPTPNYAPLPMNNDDELLIISLDIV